MSWSCQPTAPPGLKSTQRVAVGPLDCQRPVPDPQQPRACCLLHVLLLHSALSMGSHSLWTSPADNTPPSPSAAEALHHAP